MSGPPEDTDKTTLARTRISGPNSDDATTTSEDLRLRARRVGPFVLIKELGHGGQGFVWLAEDTRLQRRVALKMLADYAALNEQARMRFLREAEIASKLQHPGICGVLEFGEHAGLPYIAMPYLEGEALDRKLGNARAAASGDDTSSHLIFESEDATPTVELSTEGSSANPSSPTGSSERRDTTAAIRLVEEAARAMHVAHEAGLVHRDIKPGNIMVTTEDRVVLLDFGLARDNTTHGVTLTKTGDVFGTPAYMSPEQIAGHRDIDRRTDVYSLGVTLFECLTLVRPFHGSNREALYKAIIDGQPPRPRSLNPAISRDLEVVTLFAMQRDRDRRYQTALDFAEDLRRVIEREPIIARSVGPMTRSWRWAQRNPVVACLCAALLISLLGGLVTTVKKNSSIRRESDAKSRALTRSRNAIRSRDAALADFQRLADVQKLRDAHAASAALFPAHPDLVPRFEAWQEQYGGLSDRLAIHEETLERISARIGGGEDELDRLREEFRRLEKRVDAGRETEEDLDRLDELEDRIDELADAPPITADPTDVFVADALRQHVAALRGARAQNGLFQNIARRKARSARMEETTLTQFEAEWRDAIEAIETSPLYDGLEISPQLGLIPLGPDPSSGLFEFLHWVSHSLDHPLPQRVNGEPLAMTRGCGIILVLIPGGRFLMGAQSQDAEAPGFDPMANSREGPPHEIEIDPFFLSKFEVTQDQWLRFTGKNPSGMHAGLSHGDVRIGLLHPVEFVSWERARLVTERLGLELPTEAQWEFGARATTTSPWWPGSDVQDLAGSDNLADAAAIKANVDWPDVMPWLDDGYPYHAPVGTFAANGFGLHDMGGNVGEWCRDLYVLYNRPVEPGTGARQSSPEARHRVRRGGLYTSGAASARTSFRGKNRPDHASWYIGVRPALALTR